ncbi:protein TWIN LOV 1-like isoform X2 [Phoenix dactylifera]|uniref:Protein TWIN LOV 1-like isoform X2 n=1 Tax=Phoenix dactylifera TaxID=42345 RepID=A0A8B8J5U2_PHODC|nr:protein TWIN LOV 1-like isoform X2 [Phoenix dactylifera]
MVAVRLRPIGTVDDRIRRRTKIAPPRPPAATVEEGMGSFHERMIDESLTSRYSDWIVEALDELPDNFLITDPGISGHPIVFASRGFLAMSGYAREEVVGRNGRIFQGPATERRSVMEIREAIREERTLQISLLNYRKDGTPHWILFHLCPVFGMEDGRVIHFVAVQVPIPRRSRCARSGANGMVYGACRNEVRLDDDYACNLAVDSVIDMDNKALEAEESRKASVWEKEKASNAANSILSTLTHYSKLTGRVVCTKRCSSAGIAPLSSSLNISLGRIKQSFVLTDPHLPDMPIVYANDEFLSLTGYSRHEVLGRNCRFLNGPGTDAGVLHQIKDCILAEQACSVRLLNYRKDGSSFWNRLHISPVRNASGKKRKPETSSPYAMHFQYRGAQLRNVTSHKFIFSGQLPAV